MAKNRIDARKDEDKYNLSKRKGHKSPTQKGKTRKRTVKQKEKENARRMQIGQRRALAELDNPNTIYILGDIPVYLHSNQVYYKKGKLTAINMLNTRLQSLVNQVHKQINSLIPILNSKIKNILQIGNFSNFEEFANWWETKVLPFNNNIEKDNEALYYLMLLEKFKKNATLISSYKYLREKNPNNAQPLIDNGFVLADFKLEQGTRARKEDPITKIREDQRKIMSDLSVYLKKILPDTDGFIETAIQNILEGNDAGKINKTYATQIGNLHEYFTALIKQRIVDGIKINLENIAAEKHSELNKSSKTFKADTKATLINAKMSVEILMSDKSGMRYAYGHKYDSNIQNTLDLFTASLESKTFDIFNTTTSIDMSKIDPNINKIFNYIIKNSDFFGIKDYNVKDLILSFFAWAKIIIEITGFTNNNDDLVPIIRMFNRLYQTADILRKFQGISGTKILTYVNKAYLDDYYNIYELNGGPTKEELLERKKDFLINNKSNTTTYKDIKNAILSTLWQLNNVSMNRPGFSTQYSIIMNNINNLL